MNWVSLASVAIAALGFAYTLWVNARRDATDLKKDAEGRIGKLEESLKDCERKHDDLQKQLNVLRGENEWLRGENIRLQQRMESRPT